MSVTARINSYDTTTPLKQPAASYQSTPRSSRRTQRKFLVVLRVLRGKKLFWLLRIYGEKPIFRSALKLELKLEFDVVGCQEQLFSLFLLRAVKKRKTDLV
jgi:hypothetical protein